MQRTRLQSALMQNARGCSVGGCSVRMPRVDAERAHDERARMQSAHDAEHTQCSACANVESARERRVRANAVCGDAERAWMQRASLEHRRKQAGVP